ncbi:MAG: ISL3 family transposase [Chloroflexi bacterium]|nr:ISL3 family transposase [Chloroflexota bacterium]
MRGVRVWASLLGVERAIVEDVELEEATDAMIVSVRLRRRDRSRCGICHRRCPGYDAGDGRRRWRALDLGTTRAYLEAAAQRVQCPAHGVVVAAVPWARHGAGHTRAFDDTVAWLAVHTSKSAVVALLRCAWRTVGAIITRVVADAEAGADRLEGLRRIGIDEISHRRGQRYITVVVDHASGRLVWAAEGRSEKTLERFFDALGPERSAAIELVSADGAEWIERVVGRRCPGATLCTDPFHVVSWATEALDAVRREVWNQARRRGEAGLAQDLKGARFALWKNPEHLTGRQQTKLAWIAATNEPLYRAYLLKEELRMVFTLRGAEGRQLLEDWLAWARRSQLPSFVELARKVARHRAGIEATLLHGLSNARVESVNTKIRLLTRIAFGFHSAKALIALAMLSLGGLCPSLPGR